MEGRWGGVETVMGLGGPIDSDSHTAKSCTGKTHRSRRADTRAVVGKMDAQPSVAAVAHKLDEILPRPDIITAKDDGPHSKCSQVIKNALCLDSGEDDPAAAIGASRDRIPRHDWSIGEGCGSCGAGGVAIRDWRDVARSISGLKQRAHIDHGLYMRFFMDQRALPDPQ